MKPFQEQFCECEDKGFHGKSKFKSFDDYPEYLPFLPNKKMIKAIEEGSLKGINFTTCLRFDEENVKCSSKHSKCIKLRKKTT